MEAIVLTIISGLFSLAAIWYQNYLQKKSVKNEQVNHLANTIDSKGNKSRKLNVWQIIFTIVIVICPIFLLLVVGKENLTGTDKYLMEYYFIWVIITLTALVIGWKSKTLFEKIILIISLIVLVYITFQVMDVTKRNSRYQIEQN